MNQLKTAAAVTIALTGAAQAGGIERTDQSMRVLFEQGEYVELSFRSVVPSVSGEGGPQSPTPGAKSGSILDDYFNYGAAYKGDIGENLSYAVIFDQPFGANVTYPVSDYFGSGTTAELKANALTGVLQYNLDSGVSVYGGLRIQTMEADARIPFLAGYSVAGTRDIALGYLVGVAYEKPEIGARVALTYNSRIKHNVPTNESFGTSSSSTKTEIETPQSVNLEFQTGVNPKTLVFGSIRWVEWSEFEIAPPTFYESFGSPIASYEDDRITYNLGVGRKLTDKWSVFGAFGYEKETGSPTGNLNPVDGFQRYTLGASYTQGKMKATAGVTYVNLGDADSRLGALVPAGEFKDNSAYGVGIRIGWSL